MSASANRVPSAGDAELQSSPYRPIGDYGVIGDCRTAALVAPDGSIDWCCLPHFDSPAIFCRLLDAERGGYFRLAPSGAAQATMRYLDGTNMLATTFISAAGEVQLLDFMPVRARRTTPIATAQHFLHDLTARFAPRRTQQSDRDQGNDVAAAHRLTRIATAIAGDTIIDLSLKATFDYARQSPSIEHIALDAQNEGAILSAGNHYLAFVLRRDASAPDDPPIHLQIDDAILHAHVPLRQGQRVVAMLNYARNRPEALHLIQQLHQQDVDADYEETLQYWRDWSAQCRYQGPYQEAVLRSALALKLCTFEPTGAIVAAPTTSLPEAIGGPRNWDYRYTWLRDASLTLDALDGLGYQQEARDYFHFLHDLHQQRGTDLRIMYSIYGASGDALAEQELPHLAGYYDSRPVHIGNGAATQHQLDVYGELIDAAYRYLLRGGFTPQHLGTNRDVLPLITQIADYVVAHWQDLDQGIWEVRGVPRAFVYSRVMCWVALDRACKVSGERNRARWAQVRDQIREDILAHGYDPTRQTFVQAYDASALDAANLRLPLVGFLPANDAHMRGTIAATLQTLAGPHDLLYRYRTPASATQESTTDDGLTGSEGAFAVCTFWLIEDLCGQGRVDEARQRFEHLLHFASPLGLFAEEIDFHSGAHLGNYPQALTHIGLINAALALQQAQ